jgi:hypothetical protein
VTYQTAEQAKKGYIEKMGEPLGVQFHELRQEVIYLYRKWMEYVTLFGTKPSRLELLNKTAPTFFRTLQDSGWDDTLLHIARLTDPSEMGKFKNLTLQNLPGLITDAKLKQKIGPLVKKILEQSEFCREWRNKLVAHRDLDAAINGTADQISGGSRDQVNAVLKTMAELLNAIELHFKEATTAYDFDSSYQGAKNLLLFLDDGIKRHDERRARIRNRQGTPEDFAQREI